MRVVWTESAISDLISIRDYIERDNPEAAERVALSILNSVEMLEANPKVGRLGRVTGTRELVIAKYPYIIPYRIRDQQAELLRVIHTRREWPDESS